MAQICTSRRRYYLFERRAAVTREDLAIADMWQLKQQEEGGVELPSDFPYLARLNALFYSTREDVDGADECEFTELGFTTREAQAILTAFSALT